MRRTSPEPPSPLAEVDAVVLAGGRGTRLHPHIAAVPKALIRLGDHPLLEILLCQLEAAGLRRVHLALGHLGDQIEAFVAQRPPSALQIRTRREAQPLGTAGPVRLIEPLSDPFLLLNGDVLTTLSCAEVYACHRRQRATATVAVTRRSLPIPYGVVERSAEARVVGVTEKPHLTVEIAMGVYVFARRALAYLPPAQRVDAPDLLHALLAAGEPIAACESHDYWKDIGQPDDLEAAQRDVRAAPERFLAPPRRVAAVS